jgi:hypothetical protein
MVAHTYKSQLLSGQRQAGRKLVRTYLKHKLKKAKKDWVSCLSGRALNSSKGEVPCSITNTAERKKRGKKKQK